MAGLENLRKLVISTDMHSQPHICQDQQQYSGGSSSGSGSVENTSKKAQEAHGAMEKCRQGKVLSFGELMNIENALGHKILPDVYDSFKDRRDIAMKNLQNLVSGHQDAFETRRHITRNEAHDGSIGEAREALARVENGGDANFGELRKIEDLLGYKIMPDHFEGFNDRKNQAISNLRELLARDQSR
jgi:hypothetical protein